MNRSVFPTCAKWARFKVAIDKDQWQSIEGIYQSRARTMSEDVHRFLLHIFQLMLLLLINDTLNMLQEEDFHLDSRHLTLKSPPSSKFTLEIVTEIYPQKNTSLEVT